MSDEIKNFFSTYTEFVTKVTSDPSIDLDSLKKSFDDIESSSSIKTPPASAQKIPRVMGPVEKAIRLENTTRMTATKTEDFWNPILSILPPQIGLRIKFEKAPPMRIIPAVEPDTLNSSRATTATNTLIPMGPAATIKVANPMRITFRSNRFLNDGMLET